MPRTVATISTDRSMAMPIRSPIAQPCRSRCCETWWAIWSSSSYDHARSPNRTAVRRVLSCACRSKRSTTVRGHQGQEAEVHVLVRVLRHASEDLGVVLREQVRLRRSEDPAVEVEPHPHPSVAGVGDAVGQHG